MAGLARQTEASGCGTVFKCTPTTGTEEVLHSFGSSLDGVQPYAALIDVSGALYGTTAYGGDVTSRTGLGTVFKISANGKEQVLHNYGISDGWHPDGALTDVNRVLYGTHAGSRAGRMMPELPLTSVRKGRSRCCTVFAAAARMERRGRWQRWSMGLGELYGTTKIRWHL